MRTGRWGAAVLAVGAVLAVAACERRTPEFPPPRPLVAAGAPTSTTSTAPTSTTAAAPVDRPVPLTPADPRWAELTLVYDNAVRVVEVAAMVPDPDSPILATWNTGPALEAWRAVVEDLRVRGRRLSSPVPTVRRVGAVGIEMRSPTEAVLDVCITDDALIVEVATGLVVDDDVVTRRHRALLRDEAGWKLVEQELLDDTEQACAATP